MPPGDGLGPGFPVAIPLMREDEYPAGVAGTGWRQLRKAATWLGLYVLLANTALAAGYECVAL